MNPFKLFSQFPVVLRTGFVIGFAVALASVQVQAKPVPSNLGNGLDKLVANNLALSAAKSRGVKLKNTFSVNGKT